VRPCLPDQYGVVGMSDHPLGEGLTGEGLMRYGLNDSKELEEHLREEHGRSWQERAERGWSIVYGIRDQVNCKGSLRHRIDELLKAEGEVARLAHENFSLRSQLETVNALATRLTKDLEDCNGWTR
jgi:hypothetical protein